ncbi:hypothetical protein NQ317_019206 [Molorchus minor]|uniref:Pseudouridine synthase RsuA/RluA-like domain-containing protein n=1 Tax=Molorchus minor TaxID=1323400 RepID=A0ABQ9JS34_9CUCU|nr:hypothetical protein NQ317_019206 [Molorchus minor]
MVKIISKLYLIFVNKVVILVDIFSFYKVIYFFHTRLKVLYNSNNFIVIDKQADMKINSNNIKERTVQTLLKEEFPLIANEKLFHEYYFPHRLDFATSGVMCIPLHKQACQLTSKAFFYKRKPKILYCYSEDTREQNIQKMCTTKSKYCIKPREARTIFVVLENGIYDNYPATKILIKPITGRRHQIRVHCTYLGHTIVGDYTYSNRKDVEPPRMFLHCIRLVLPNPLESLDIHTSDPFLNVKNWKPIHKINDINNIMYNKYNGVFYNLYIIIP